MTNNQVDDMGTTELLEYACSRDMEGSCSEEFALNMFKARGIMAGPLNDNAISPDEFISFDFARGIVKRDAPNFGCHSFTGDTRILMADGTTKPIDEVKVGDEVANSQPESSTTEKHKVTTTHVTDLDRHFVTLTVETRGGPRIITTTDNHPFYDTTAHQWITADRLRRGDHLHVLADAQDVQVTALRAWTGAVRTYDLTIDDVHTYYVVAGNTPVLVHNNDGSDLPDRDTARVRVMQQAGIPLDAEPIDELRNASGVQYVYDVDGRYMLVTENTMDRSHPGEPHWEAGPAKPGLQVDNYGRYRVSNNKVKENFTYGSCG